MCLAASQPAAAAAATAAAGNLGITLWDPFAWQPSSNCFVNNGSHRQPAAAWGLGVRRSTGRQAGTWLAYLSFALPRGVITRVGVPQLR
jgi:hypothetical protein